MIGEHDVLVVGAGCAGMRAAIAAHDAGADVAMVSKLHPTRSHSGAAEGGINAALGNAADDSPETHAYDTVKGSDYLGDQDSIELFTREAPGDIIQLENWGAVFSRREDGKLAQRPFGQGSRMPIAATRAMLHATLSGGLDRAEFRTDPTFGFAVPVAVPGVDTALLDPRSTWRDTAAYDAKAAELAAMFRENFQRFAGEAPSLADAGPRA